MTTLTVTTIDRDGVAMDFTVNATAADKFLNDGKTLLAVVNTDGSPHTVNVAGATTLDGLTIGPRTIVVAAGAYVYAGPFPMSRHNDADGYVNLTYSATTGMKVCPLKTVPL